MRIFVTSKEQAARMLQSEHNLRYLISIGDAEGDRPLLGFSDFKNPRLRLLFDDINTESHFWYSGCTVEDISRLVAFCQTIVDAPGDTLIHCAQGQSRSTAAALVLLHLLGHHAPTQLTQVIQETMDLGFRSQEDSVHPNCRVVDMASQVLEGSFLQDCVRAYPHFARYGYGN